MLNGKRAVLYLRLSKEDVNKLHEGDDSASIINQRLLLTDWALEHDFQIVGIYSDDDESGLYDTRPDFERMLRDAKLGMFDVIVSKTQSRFSRNMEHIEKYLHHDLPNLGIRFIGVVDGVDTINQDNKKSRQIAGLVNEWYCEDLSKNVRSALIAKKKAGKYVSSSCKYGYVKDPMDKNKLIVDEEASKVVKRIFSLYRAGNSAAKIASILTRDGVPTPTVYKTEVLKLPYQNAKIKVINAWVYQTVMNILEDRGYTGVLVQNKYKSISYKDRKKVRTPKDEWIVVKNAIPQIIDEQLFEECQLILKSRARPVNPDGKKHVSLFSGKVYCAECERRMVHHFSRDSEKRHIGYICSTYKKKGKHICSRHFIELEELTQCVLTSIRQQAEMILTHEDIVELSTEEVSTLKMETLKDNIKRAEGRIDRVQTLKQKSFESYCSELLTREEYVRYTADYDKQISIAAKELEVLRLDLKNEKRAVEEYDEWVNAFKNYVDVDKLTRDMVIELVDKILVHADGSITIYYKFKNPLECK